MEYNFNEKFSVYAMDLVNYGNTKDKEEQTKHYLTAGGAYRMGSTRVALGYGRQRGGLVCVGGVCRFVPESTGISLSFNTAF
jgi:predicted porin